MSNTNLPTQTSSVLLNDTVSSCSTSKVQENIQLSRSRCMNSLREVKSQSKFLSETFKDFGTMLIFKRTFSQDLDLLEHHLTKNILSQTNCNTTLTKLKAKFENAFNSESKEQDSNSKTASSKSVKESSLDSATKDVHAIKYKMSKAKERRMTYFQSLHSHLQVLSKENLKGTRIEHGFKRAFMSLFGQDADTFTKSSGIESEVQDDSSRSGNDTDADDADIRPIYDEEPMAEYPEQCHVKSPMLDSSPDNQATEYSKQSLESKNILLKKTVAQFQKDFSRMEAHCIALELKYQNQALKSGQHGQILNETSNKAKIKKEIDVLETMNIELENSVAKLRKENETLKNHYKDLYDSIKIMRSKTIEQTTSLLANNADLKAQIQEKVFAIAAL
ncbi:hypothetical protein Tco_1132203 [Tanacetum coccineum]|uniref:Uncharacterized protein n=1 Tax=Tanacetum coccineum TaxID=301880 RepID=A0ABQ5JB93_9ASTR